MSSVNDFRQPTYVNVVCFKITFLHTSTYCQCFVFKDTSSHKSFYSVNPFIFTDDCGESEPYLYNITTQVAADADWERMMRSLQSGNLLITVCQSLQ